MQKQANIIYMINKEMYETTAKARFAFRKFDR